MKRFIAIILAIFYTLSSTGATFNMHYCMGKLVQVKLWSGDSGKCKRCKKGHNKSCPKKCCKEEQKVVKLNKDQKAAESTFQELQLAAAVLTKAVYTGAAQQHPVAITAAYPVSNAPPRYSKVHTHILNCLFRI